MLLSCGRGLVGDYGISGMDGLRESYRQLRISQQLIILHAKQTLSAWCTSVIIVISE